MTHPNNLPIQPTTFIGREQEVATLYDLMRRPEVRLLTLTGPGGVGKTRLSLQVAAELSEVFPDGVFVVPLAPISDPEQVIPTIAQTLSIGEVGDQPLLALVKSVLKEKCMLLLLDNFEQVSDAALQIANLLSACPLLKVLMTSREVLHVRAEQEYAVPPFPVPNPKRLPDLATLEQYAPVMLFIARAQAVNPAFALTTANAPFVAGMCARLDGLPLAIELAAARVKYYQPQALLARLEQGLALLSGGARDLPARQRTLRGAIAWSYELLSSQEQTLFRRLAVFVDGCTVEAAADVCAAVGELAGDVLETMLSLVDKSLLRQAEQGEEEQEGEPRFWMLQVLREFGLERLASAEELETTRAAHALYFLARAEEAEPHLRGAESGSWFAHLAQEHENLRAALTFLLERAGMRTDSEEGKVWAELAMRLSGALYWFWNIRGYYREGRRFLERALTVREGVAAPVQVKVLYAATELAICQDDFERAEALCRESLAIFEELGDRWSTAEALLSLARVAVSESKFAEASARYQESVAIAREITARDLIASALEGIGALVAAQGTPGWAARLWGAAQALRVAIGAPLPPVYRADYESALATARTMLGKEACAIALAEGETMALEQTLDILPRVFSRLDDIAILRQQQAMQPGQEFSSC